MAWITANTPEGREANIQTSQIAVILERVQGDPRQGSEILLASGTRLEVTESPAELLRAVEHEEHPQNVAVSPREAW